LSERPADWGVFGDYLGGVLGPILAFASFMVVLVSLYENRLQAAEERRARGIETLMTAFTRLIERISETVHDLRYERTRVTPVGLGGPRAWFDEWGGGGGFRAIFEPALKSPYLHEGGARSVKRYAALMKKLDADWGYELGVFFRLLNPLFTFIALADLP